VRGSLLLGSSLNLKLSTDFIAVKLQTVYTRNMANNETQTKSTRALAARLVFAALKILKENAGEMRGKQVLEEVEKRVPLGEWEKERYEKSGYIRWRSVLHFFTIDLIHAGFLIKKKGVWFLTPEGDSALKLGEDELLDTAQKKYREWRLKNPRQAEVPETEIAIVEESAKEEEISADEIEESAREQIENYINKKNPYEFQDLAAALLRGMGYFTPFVAPVGKDGGVDIVAYRDPLGTLSPRIKVQIKHRESSATVSEVRQLMGLLGKDGDVGIFISSGGFTPDAKTTARNANVHVELVDLPRFVTLWQEFYQKLTDEDKTKLPLFPIYLLATTV
jgi:restriction system protein